MELVKPGINLDFVGKMKVFFSISIILTIASLLFLIFHGLNLGIDFAGGISLQIQFNQATTVDKIRGALKEINLENSVIQQVGSKESHEFLLRTEIITQDLKGLTERIEEVMTSAFGKGAFEVRKAEVVGPKAGRDLARKGLMALIFANLGMLIYIAWRYEFRFALGGIITLVHDVIVTAGVFTLLGKEFTLTIIAALLTIVGYSINDTVVVFDRIRENMKKSTKQGLRDIINSSINQTLSRTLLTSLTVVLVLVALFFFGGEVIHDFAFTLLIGVVFGTYSSIFIASPLVLVWESFRTSRRKREKPA